MTDTRVKGTRAGKCPLRLLQTTMAIETNHHRRRMTSRSRKKRSMWAREGNFLTHRGNKHLTRSSKGRTPPIITTSSSTRTLSIENKWRRRSPRKLSSGSPGMLRVVLLMTPECKTNRRSLHITKSNQSPRSRTLSRPNILISLIHLITTKWQR